MSSPDRLSDPTPFTPCLPKAEATTVLSRTGDGPQCGWLRQRGAWSPDWLAKARRDGLTEADTAQAMAELSKSKWFIMATEAHAISDRSC